MGEHQGTAPGDCNQTATDIEFVKNATSSAAPPHYPRIMCLYPAMYPQEKERIDLVSSTYARHCHGALFFVASTEVKPLLELRDRHYIVNLLSVMPHRYLRPDSHNIDDRTLHVPQGTL